MQSIHKDRECSCRLIFTLAAALSLSSHAIQAGSGEPPADQSSSFIGWYFKTREVEGVSYHPDGPVDGGALYRGLPVAKANDFYLGRDGHTIFRWDDEHDVYKETSPGGDFSWPRGTTFDTTRNRFVVVTLVGEGTLYAVQPATLEWSTIASMNNVDVDSIVYHYVDDHLYMVENHGGPVRILRYNSDGQPDGEPIIIQDVPLAIGSSYQSRLISAGEKIALLIEATPGWTLELPAESRIYMVDPVSRTSQLTYRRIWETWPPNNQPPPPPPPPTPTIAILTPPINATFDQGKVILVNTRGNVAFSNVWIFADEKKIGDALPAAGTISPPNYYFPWSNAPAGSHILRAIGFTGNSSATSGPVRIVVRTNTPAMAIERALPERYFAGQWLTVSIIAKPTNINAWAVEETPPAGWQFGQASHSGAYDSATGKIKWGPFTDSLAQTLIYTIRPPTNSTGLKIFSGIVSVNGVSKAIGGDTTISDAPAHHPADSAPEDFRLTVNEITAYAAAWKAGAGWPRGPSPIPLEYVTRAGQIWKSGEQYQFNPALRPPTCWMPTTQLLPKAALVAASLSVSSASRILPPAFTPGRVTTVSVTARPAAGVQNYAIEERVPDGWTVADAEGATATDGVLRYGPFYDAEERTFVYHVVPSAGASGAFAGFVSFDGSKDAIEGGALLNPPTTAAEHRDGSVYLRFNATPGEQFILESAESIDSASWQFEATIQGADSTVDLPAITPSAAQKFYRLRPVAP